MVAISAAIALSGAVGATAGTYSGTVLADNPIAYYRLEELPGATVVLDSSVSGAYAGTYFFDDSGNYPELGEPGIDTNSVAVPPVSERQRKPSGGDSFFSRT